MIYTIFPTVIHSISTSTWKESKDELIKFVYEERKKDPEGEHHSNRGGWQSRSNFHANDNILSSFVSKELSNYYSETGYYGDNIDLSIDGLWININFTDSHNIQHCHPCSDLAGVVWFKTPPNCGIIKFDSPHGYPCGSDILACTDQFKEQLGHWMWYNIEPEEGKMIVFPSSLYHRVEPNLSNDDRISVSFNIWIRQNNFK